jgi:hypothetical protein
VSTEQVSQYDLSAKIAYIKSLAQKTHHDGLRMVRLIGPELNPTYNDQIGVAECQTPEQLVCESNRGSKSFTAACKFAAVARDVPLTTWDGRQIDCRLPAHRGLPLTLWVVGLQLNHIGDTMFRLLFEEGQFQMIMDPKTLAWRTFRPWEKWDAENARKRKPAPPLIPPHEIDQDSWVWENKGAKQVAKVSLRNGTRFHFYPSTGDVKKGDPVHGIWIDELIRYSDHYPEWIMRLTDYEGFLLWSTMIYRNVSALNALMDDAQRQKEEVERGERKPEKMTATVFKFKQGGNPYLNQERVETNREILERFGDDEIKMRIDGGSIFDSTLIYPFFDKKTHAAIPDGTPPKEPNKDWDALALVLHSLGGLPPVDWTHELIIDPGAQKPAVLFCAVPPQFWTDQQGREWSLWGAHGKPYFVPYDEIYGKRYSWQGSDSIADVIQQKMRNIRFRRFIIDMSAAKQTALSGGMRYRDIFSQEFERRGIESEETGFGFTAGLDQFSVRSRIVDGWMQPLQSGKPQLRIVTKRCPNLVWQLAHNQRRMVGEVVLDEEEKRERNDLRVCCEYWASRRPAFVPVTQSHVDPMQRRQRRKIEELFGSAVEEGARCHFGPGLAPRGVAV